MLLFCDQGASAASKIRPKRYKVRGHATVSMDVQTRVGVRSSLRVGVRVRVGVGVRRILIRVLGLGLVPSGVIGLGLELDLLGSGLGLGRFRDSTE